MKNSIFIIAAIIILTTSCKKWFTDPNIYTIKGKVYVGCNKTPVANARVVYVDNGIVGNGTGTNNGNLIVGVDTTDSEGNFEIVYKMPEGEGNLIEPNLTVQGVNTLYGVPGQKNIDNIEVYSIPTCNLNVKLNAINPYSNLDTLYINDLLTGSGNLKIAGPFTTGTLYSVPNFNVRKLYYTDIDNPILDSADYVGYKLNNGDWKLKYFVPLPCSNIDAIVNLD